jgi:hypothetical protein
MKRWRYCICEEVENCHLFLVLLDVYVSNNIYECNTLLDAVFEHLT